MKKYDEIDLKEMFNEMLDECDEPINICGMTYLVSDTLETMDPVAYKCMLNDYVDGLLQDEIIFEHADGEYYDEPEADEGEE